MGKTAVPVQGRRPFSLAARLTTWYAISAFGVVLASTGFLYWVLVVNLARETDETLADQVHILRSILADRPGDIAALEQEVEWELAARQHAPIFVRILSDDHRTVVESPRMGDILPAQFFPSAVSAGSKPGLGVTLITQSGVAYRVLTAKASIGESDAGVRILQVAVDQSREEGLLEGYRRSLWLILIFALIVCAAGGYGIAQKGIRPVKEITSAARQVRSTTLGERLDIAGLPAELAELAITFNDMLDRLELSFAKLSRFSADLAHELRTPLNNLRGEVEVTLGRPRAQGEYCDTLGSCLEEFVRLSDIIDGLLFLARAENPQSGIPREPLDVGHEVAVVVEFYEPVATEAGIQLLLDIVETASALLNRPLFQRALGNLIENAIKHTPSGGTVTLSVNRMDDCFRVEVADTGQGIPENHLPHITERFYRVDPSRDANHGGVGLGLAIVESVMALHGGILEVASEVGHGTRVGLICPCNPT